MTNHDPKNKECPQYGQSEKHLETCNLSCTCSRQEKCKECGGSGVIATHGFHNPETGECTNCPIQEECEACKATGFVHEKQDWEARFDKIKHVKNGGCDGCDKNTEGIDEIRDFIRTILQEAKEEGRRESEVYCACGDMLEKDWLGFGGRVCASCEPIEREKIAEQARHAVIAEVEKWGWKNITDKLDWANLRAFLASLKTNSK